jgi:hypothetical protein
MDEWNIVGCETGAMDGHGYGLKFREEGSYLDFGEKFVVIEKTEIFVLNRIVK